MSTDKEYDYYDTNRIEAAFEKHKNVQSRQVSEQLQQGMRREVHYYTHLMT